MNVKSTVAISVLAATSLVLAFAYLFAFSGIGEKITAQCQVNRLGEGHCQFTNTGWSAGAKCIEVGLENTQGVLAKSGTVCSGRIWPDDSVRKEVTVLSDPSHCASDESENWLDNCEIQIIENGASLSAVKHSSNAAADSDNAGAPVVQTPPSSVAPAQLPKASTSTFTPFKPNGEISMLRCHMGGCSYAKWLSVTTSGSTGLELDLDASIMVGYTDLEMDEGYPESVKEAIIEWDGGESTNKITCSLIRPTVNGQLLPLNPKGVPGLYVDASELYFNACHSHFDGYPSGIEKYSYSVEEE